MYNKEDAQKLIELIQSAITDANVVLVSETYSRPELNVHYVRLYTGLQHVDFKSHQEWLAFMQVVANINIEKAFAQPA